MSVDKPTLVWVEKQEEVVKTIKWGAIVYFIYKVALEIWRINRE